MKHPHLSLLFNPAPPPKEARNAARAATSCLAPGLGFYKPSLDAVLFIFSLNHAAKSNRKPSELWLYGVHLEVLKLLLGEKHRKFTSILVLLNIYEPFLAVFSAPSLGSTRRFQAPAFVR